MFRYKLRTLLIVLALGPPLLAAAYFCWQLAFEWAILIHKVLLISVAILYAVVFIGMLASQCWKTYWRPNRPR